MNDDVQSIVTALMREGYEIVRGGKHLRVERDGTLLTTLPLTPSDHRWRKNKVRELISKGMLKRDPKSNYTPPKEQEMPRGGAMGKTLTDSEHSTLEALFSLVTETEGLHPGKNGRLPYGIGPVLMKAVREYVRQENKQQEMPRVVYMGKEIDWFSEMDLQVGAKLLVERLLDAAKHPERKVWSSTREFLQIAVAAYEWWSTFSWPAPAAEAVEDADQYETTVEFIQKQERAHEVAIRALTGADTLNGQRERVELAIEVAASVGGHLGMDLAHRVLKVK